MVESLSACRRTFLYNIGRYHSCQEMWNCPYSNDSFPIYAEDIEAGGDAAPSFSMLSDVARSLQITIVGGSIPEHSGDHLYNTCCVFGADGNLKGKHRKVQYVNCSDASCISYKLITLLCYRHKILLCSEIVDICVNFNISIQNIR